MQSCGPPRPSPGFECTQRQMSGIYGRVGGIDNLLPGNSTQKLIQKFASKTLAGFLLHLRCCDYYH
eukprot:scaffold56629_cov45-Prasinocladus_malaysianus.AAC.2